MLQTKEAREAKGLTQKELAIAAGLDVGTVNRIERGKHNPTINVAVRLALALGVSLDELVVQDETASTTPGNGHGVDNDQARAISAKS